MRRAFAYFAAQARAGRLDPRRCARRRYGLYLLTRSGQVKTKEARALRDALVARPADRLAGRPGRTLPRGDVPAAQPRRRRAEAPRRRRARPPGRRSDYREPLRRADRAWLRPLPAREALPRPGARARARRRWPRSPTSSRSSTRSRPARSCSASTRTRRSCRPPTARVTHGRGRRKRRRGRAARGDGRRPSSVPPVPDGAAKIRVTGPGGTPLFTQLVQAGFDRERAGRQGRERHRGVARDPRREREARHDVLPSRRSSTSCCSCAAPTSAEREVALIDLLPGGFEVDLVVRRARRRGARSAAATRSGRPSYVDVREDRVVLYGWVGAAGAAVRLPHQADEPRARSACRRSWSRASTTARHGAAGSAARSSVGD